MAYKTSINFSKQNIKCIILDWDGTLSNSVENLAIAFQKTCQNLMIPVPDKITIQKSFGESNHFFLNSLLAKESEKKQPNIVSKQTFLDMFRQISDSTPLILIDNVKTTLKKLQQQDYILCIASHKNISRLKEAIEITNTATYFTYVYGTPCFNNQTYHSTAAPFFYANPIKSNMLTAICEKTGLSPKQCLMVGDGIIDITSANENNMPSIGILGGSHTETELYEHNPAAIIKSITKLPLWLEQ